MERLGSMSSYIVALQAAVILFATLTSGVFENLSNKNMKLLSDFARVFATLLPVLYWLSTGSLPISVIAVVILEAFEI